MVKQRTKLIVWLYDGRICSLLSEELQWSIVWVLEGALCAGTPLKWFSPLLPPCWHAITSHKFPGHFQLPVACHVSLFAGRLCSPKSSGAVSLPSVAGPRGAQKPFPAPVLGGGGEQEGVGSTCWTCVGALQVWGWGYSGTGAQPGGPTLIH